MTGEGPGQGADWRQFVTDELKADPVVAQWMEKASEKDVPTILKSYAHAQKRLGASITLPGANASPDDLQAFRRRLYDAKVLPAPPASPEEYRLAAPEGLPSGMTWNDELAKAFATVLHRHGVTQAAVDELVPLYVKSLRVMVPSLEIDREQALAQLRHEHGDQFEARKEMVRRIADTIFRDPNELEFLERTGLGNHPRFLSVLMRVAALGMQDSSFVESLKAADIAEGDRDAAFAEYAKIATDPQHPMHAGYLRRDPKVEAYIDGLYRKAFPKETSV